MKTLKMKKNEHPVDFLNELKSLNRLRQEWSVTDWSEFKVFKVITAKTWMDFDNPWKDSIVMFTAKDINQ